MDGETYGCIDTNGKITISSQKFKFIYAFKNGLAQVKIDGSKGEYDATIDRTGKIVSSSASTAIYPHIKPEFGNGLSPKLVGDRLGYEDKSGKLVIPARYGIPDRGMGQTVPELSIGLCGDNDRCVGTSINFRGGLAPVILPERCGIVWTRNCYGYIDTTGKLVFKF
jgi:WG containing repeat